MIISGMNRYFARHGRIIGLVIVVIISVTFVLYFGRVSIFDSFRGGPSTSVSVLGRKVTLEDRKDEVTRMVILASLTNPDINLNNRNIPLGSQTIISNILQNYAAIDMGLAAGDKQIAEFLRKAPVFQTNGKFDKKKYDDYIKNRLKPAYMTQEDLKEAVREQLQIEALRKEITQSVIVPEGEVKDAFINLYQTVDARLLRFNASSYAKEVKVTDEALKNYFNANKNKYMTSGATKGAVVRFAFAAFKEEAYKSIKDKDLKDFYNRNKFRYIKQQPKNIGAKAPTAPKYKTFDEVKHEITVELLNTKTQNLAQTEAQKFADEAARLTSDVFYDESDPKKALDKCIKIFDQEAGKAKHKVESTGWLKNKQLPNAKGLAKEYALISAMNNLQPDNPVSEPVKGEKEFFVVLLEGKLKPQPETFENVKEQVKKDYIKVNSIKLAREKARDISLKIGEMLDKGKKIADIEKDLSVKFEKLPQISALMPLFMPDGGTIQQLAFKTKQGKVSKVERTADGAMLVYVTKKNIPSDQMFDKQKKFFSLRYKMMKQRTVYTDYISSLLQASNVAAKK